MKCFLLVALLFLTREDKGDIYTLEFIADVARYIHKS